MKIKSIIIIGTILISLGVVTYLNYPKNTKKVAFVFGQQNEVEKDIALILSHNESKVFSVPRTFRLQPGEYSYRAWGRSVIPVYGKFTVASEDLTIPLVMKQGIETGEGEPITP